MNIIPVAQKKSIKKIKINKKELPVLCVTYTAKDNIERNSSNIIRTVDTVKNNETFNINIKDSWINFGGYQSWAPGFEIAPTERQPSLKTKIVKQFNDYLVIPGTKKSFYHNKNIIIGQFVIYFRIENKYFAICSTGSVKDKNLLFPSSKTLPPVQFIINRKCNTVDIQIYDSGKEWDAKDKLAQICFFECDSYFDFKETLKVLYGTSNKKSEYYAPRYNTISQLGKTPGGWESWYNHYSKIDQNIILEDLDSLLETQNLISLSYIKEKQKAVFQIDDGWEQNLGTWEIDESKFPDGLLSITKKIEKAKLIPGLWIAPFILDYRSKTAKAHSDWILKNAKGKPVSAGFNPLWGAKFGKEQPSLPGTFFCLDLSNNEVLAYLDKLMDKAINEWGFRYLKLDFLYAGMLYGNFVNTSSAYENFDKAIKLLTKRTKTKTGKPVSYLGCGMPFEHSFNCFPLSRIGCDTLEHWENKLFKKLEWNGRTSAYLNMKDTLGRSLWNNSIYASDPDVIFIRNNNCTLTKTEKFTIAKVAILFGSQIMYSDDPAISSSKEEVALTKEILSFKKKYEKEEFSVTPKEIDFYYVESKSSKYKGFINLSDEDKVFGNKTIKAHDFIIY